MRDYITSLVQQTLKDYYKKEKTMRHLLMVLPNKRAYSQELKEHILDLSTKYEVTLSVFEADKEMLTDIEVNNLVFLEKVNEENIKEIIETTDLLYCPQVSHGFLAKLSLLLDDSPSIWLTLEMILNGKEVLLGEDLIQRYTSNPFWQKSSIDKKVLSYRSNLKRDGVHFCSMEHAPHKITEQINEMDTKKMLVLAKHIEELVKQGKKKVVVPKNSLITPMAKDSARELGVLLTEENDDEKRDGL